MKSLQKFIHQDDWAAVEMVLANIQTGKDARLHSMTMTQYVAMCVVQETQRLLTAARTHIQAATALDELKASEAAADKHIKEEAARATDTNTLDTQVLDAERGPDLTASNR